MPEDFDGRRRRYVPMDIHLAFGRFGTRLLDKWDMEGLCTWMLFLAACKREPVEGTLTYTSEDEAWTKLGARADGFTLTEFWRLTGQLHKTSRRTSGRVTYITCTVWNDWNTRAGAPRNPRKSPQNTNGKRGDANEMQQEYERDARDEVEVEVEVEREEEQEPSRELAVVTPLPLTAQHLVAHYIDRSVALGGITPPARLKGQVAKLCGEMLAEGIAPAAVQAGVDLLIERRLHPSTLPSLVHEASLPRSRAGRNGRVTPSDILAAAERARQREQEAFHDAS